MAKSLCPECGKDPGAHVAVCPHCGATQPARRLLKAPPNSIEDPDVRRWRITMRVLSILAIGSVAAFAWKLNPIHFGPSDEEPSPVPPAVQRVANAAAPPATSAIPGERTTRGTLVVNKVWEASEYAYALTTYTNTTNQTFHNLVEISCNVFNASGKKVRSNHRSFFAYRTGALAPGFTAQKEIPVDMRWSGHMSSMKCAITQAR